MNCQICTKNISQAL